MNKIKKPIFGITTYATALWCVNIFLFLALFFMYALLLFYKEPQPEEALFTNLLRASISPLASIVTAYFVARWINALPHPLVFIKFFFVVFSIILSVTCSYLWLIYHETSVMNTPTLFKSFLYNGAFKLSLTNACASTGFLILGLWAFLRTKNKNPA
jgi:hypothetical protein